MLVRLIFLLFITHFLTYCSRKTIVYTDSWAAKCECANSGKSTYKSTKEYLMSIGEYSELAYIGKDWNYLNESDLGSYSSSEYRLTVNPSFENAFSVRIVDFDTLTSVIVRIPDKEYILVNQRTFKHSKWEDFTSGIDSLFWNQDYRSKTGYPVHDGTGYTFEGLINGEYKLIERGSIGVRENQLLLDRFQSFFSEIPYQNCKKKLNCL